jgi:hypothetical protein
VDARGVRGAGGGEVGGRASRDAAPGELRGGSPPRTGGRLALETAQQLDGARREPGRSLDEAWLPLHEADRIALPARHGEQGHGEQGMANVDLANVDMASGAASRDGPV